MTYGLFMKSNVVPAAFVYFLESKNPNKSIAPLLKGDGGGGRKRKSAFADKRGSILLIVGRRPESIFNFFSPKY